MSGERAALCQRPGCPGGYEDVGGGALYCDVCGLAPVVSAEGMIGATSTMATGRDGTGGTGGRLPRQASGDSASSGSAASEPSESSARSESARSRYSQRSVSGQLGKSRGGGPSVRSVSVHSSRASAGGSGRTRLGAGLISMPPEPRPDPLTAVLDNPEVPERKRFCGNGECGAPVGRSRGARAGRTEGFCTKCGHPYSFLPKLRPGDVVKGQYEIAGCLAHGGLGWIYLAIDLAVSRRWVVLKGLLDAGDEDARQVAISERRFLAEIEHSSIVRIYNFVEHLDQRTGSVDGYIVMEYVGGRSLKEIANDRRTRDGRRDPMPVEQACAYGIEALDALAYLHSRNLLYCDFKVDNAIQQGDQLKLIDMGAVRRMDDDVSNIYGTPGFQAPEVEELGPSVASDLYTVARTLAVLTFDFQGYTTIYRDSLPDPDYIDVFREYESFYRLLVRATDPDPHRRFASAQEMAEQLTGVLREIVATRTAQPQPAISALFGPEPRVVDTELVPRAEGAVSRLGVRPVRPVLPARLTWQRRGRAVPPPPPLPPPAVQGPEPMPGAPRTVTLDARATVLALPTPKVDPDDPNAGFLAGLTGTAPGDTVAALAGAPARSVELRLRELRAHLETPGAEALETARAHLESLAGRYGSDWRVVWYRGLVALAADDRESAALAFDAVYDAFPGEIAPKLALAVCAEVLGQWDNAADYYSVVWTTDPSHVSAGFGLARVRLATGNRQGAVRALESVPETSAHWTAARVAAVRARLREREPGDDLLPDLLAAGAQVERLRAAGLEPWLGEQLSCEVLGSALDWVLAGSTEPSRPQTDPPGRLLGGPLDETGIRLGLERSHRRLARLAPTSSERTELVEAANRFRPKTWV
ncbi:serine/threonine-protein kinase [Streptomyces avicenniae]|uniref:serine/threonine-protein kinase n=1 Tax=Streptomyces avicenniae TaxID=500153 RepID=UPI00069A01DC|nr:serine/threonine-protein kinase [Streptomyces avicenniae]